MPFIEVQNKHQENFKLGILGRSKQRIYLDGEEKYRGQAFGEMGKGSFRYKFPF